MLLSVMERTRMEPYYGVVPWWKKGKMLLEEDLSNRLGGREKANVSRVGRGGKNCTVS